MNRFFLPVLLRVILILVLGFTGTYILTSTYFWLVSIWVFALFLFAVWELSRYLTKTRREYGEFLLALAQDDFSSSPPSKQKPDELQQGYQILRDRFVSLRTEMATNSHFLEALLEHAGVALIGFEQESGKITVMNKAAKTLFSSTKFHHVAAFSQSFPEIGGKMTSLKSGQDALVKIQLDGRIHQLSLNARELVLAEVPYKLISIQDIQAALENQELESWQKLIRVLTHEIKNSAIPISTLIDVIQDIILDGEEFRKLSELDPEELTDIRNGLATISRRSSALVEFVSAYGKLARLPVPRPESINAETLIRDTLRLLEESLRSHNINVNMNCNDAVVLYADRTLIEQVLINLIKNAREALINTTLPEIQIQCGLDGDQQYIEVADNGPGMSGETLEQIFVPFYSTKESGSGIGLSLSRQIMRAHRGKLEVYTAPGKGSRFRLTF